VVVLKTTVPLAALMFTPCSVRWRRVLSLASLMKRTATPLVLVLAMVSCFAVPMPPGRPSMVRNCAPFKSTVAAVVSALVMLSPTAPLAGRRVSVFAAVVVRAVKTSGNVSTVLTYAGCNSSTSAPPSVCACTSAMAAVMLA